MPVQIQSVTRALRILDILAQYPQGLGLLEIAKKAGLNASTTHHLLHTLCAADYAGRAHGDAYRLGHAVSRLYGAYLRNQQPEARLLEVLNGLVNETQETGYLVGWQDSEVVIRSIVEGPQQLRVAGLQVGFYGFTHARAAGKALLAYLPAEQLDVYLAAHPLERCTAHTIVHQVAFMSQLRQVVKQGYAMDQEEFAVGVGCVAAPIFSAAGQAVAAISISAPAWRLDQNGGRCIEAVRLAAQEASGILGFRTEAGQPTGT